MKLRHEDAVLWLALAAAAVPACVALPLLWLGDFDLKTRLTLTAAILLAGGGLALAARSRVQRPLQTLANLIGALHERDYSVRGRPPRRDDALGLAMTELGHLAEQLRAERWRDEEVAAGLIRVVEGLDAAVIAVDGRGVIALANRTADRLVGRRLANASVADLGLAHLFAFDVPRTVELALPGGTGTWEVRPSDIRLSGMPHKLVVMTDVQHALRAEERQAWQRLVRVLGHEINNSLGPIASIAETLRTGLVAPRRPDLDDDLARGLAVIERRAAALARFMHSYARLVRLPPPRPGRVDVAAWVQRTADLETRARITIAGGPPLIIPGDPDQLDQLLINLVHNAVEASAETAADLASDPAASGPTAAAPTALSSSSAAAASSAPSSSSSSSASSASASPREGVRLSWSVSGDTISIVVEDDGPGVADATNLFVPFFTTKPAGSGIGLVLARQIAEAHGGSLVLRNRRHGRGAEAVISLPARP